MSYPATHTLPEPTQQSIGGFVAPPRSVLIIHREAVICAVALAALAFNPFLSSAGPLLFMLAGAALFISHVDRSVDALLRVWPIFILPVYALLSTFWSDYPALSLRYSLQLTITLAIAALMAARIGPRHLLKIIFIVFGLLMLASVMLGHDRDDGIALGVFASKNAYAANISIFLLAAIALLFDRGSSLLFRLAAAVGFVCSPFLLLSTQAAGAFISILAAVLSFCAVLLARGLSIPSRRIYFGAVFAVLIGLGLAGALYGQELQESLLAYFDKDPTLTGRTDLWARAFEYIAERPFLGVGYQAFWVQDSPGAEQLWEMFMIKSRSGFHFHNAYISIAVELGLVGAFISSALLAASFISATRWAMLEPSAVSAFFVTFNIMLVVRSMAEVDVFYQFNVPSVVVVCSLILTSRQVRVARSLPALSRRSLEYSRAA